MGWKGTLRTINSTLNRIERENQRQQRQYEREQKALEKFEALSHAKRAVKLYDEHIEKIQSFHKVCSDSIDWQSVLNSHGPKEPEPMAFNYNEAVSVLNNYIPTFFHKLFRQVDKVKGRLQLEVDIAKQRDNEIAKKNTEKYNEQYKEWSYEVDLAKRVLTPDFKALMEVIEKHSDFKNVANEVGGSIEFNINEYCKVCVEVDVNNNDIVPHESYSLLKSGKLSKKQMSKSIYWGIYQDYICSTILRIGREVFAYLPIDKAIINGRCDILNTTTGHKEKKVILSVLLVRSTMDKLNIDLIDPSDCMNNFVHNMSFKKTQGFSPVDVVEIN